MSKSGFIRISYLIPIMLLVYGCDPSVAVPDPIDPRLPMYTERGNNVAAAFFNNEVWMSGVEIWTFGGWEFPTLMIDAEVDTATLSFHGVLPEERSLSVYFYISGFTANDKNDLQILDGTRFLLDGVNGYGVVEGINDEFQNCRLSGQIIFRKVEIGIGNRIGVSGTFSLFSDENCNAPVAMTYGRFDYVMDTSYVNP